MWMCPTKKFKKNRSFWSEKCEIKWTNLREWERDGYEESGDEADEVKNDEDERPDGGRRGSRSLRR